MQPAKDIRKILILMQGINELTMRSYTLRVFSADRTLTTPKINFVYPVGRFYLGGKCDTTSRCTFSFELK